MLNSNDCNEEWTLPEDCMVLHVIVTGQPTDLFLTFHFFCKTLHKGFEWDLFEGIQSVCTFGIPYRVFMQCNGNGWYPLNKYGWTLDHSFPKGHYIIKYIYKEIPYDSVGQPPSLSTFASIVLRTHLLTTLIPPGIRDLVGVHRHSVIGTGLETDPPTCNLETCAYQKTIEKLKYKLTVNGL